MNAKEKITGVIPPLGLPLSVGDDFRAILSTRNAVPTAGAGTALRSGCVTTPRSAGAELFPSLKKEGSCEGVLPF